MKKKWLLIAGAAVAVGLLGIWLAHVIRLNRDYTSAKAESANANEAWMGQEITANDGITYRILDAAIYDYAACMSAFPEYGWNDAASLSELKMISEGNEIKVLLYTIQLDVKEGLVPTPDTVETESGLWQSVSNPYLYEYFNQDVELIQNESAVLQIPIKLIKNSMPEEEWERLDDDDPGLRLVLCYQPEQVVYHINQVSHIYATEEDAQAMQAAMEYAVSTLQRTNEAVVYDENVVEGKGVSQGFEYELGELAYYDAAHPLEGEEEFYAEWGDWLDGVSHYYIFVATFDVENTTDERMQNYVNVGRICGVAPGDFRLKFNAEMHVIYYEGSEAKGKSAGLLELEPGERVSVRAIFFTNVSDNQFQTPEELRQMDYYLSLNQGQALSSLNDKGTLFIRFPEEIQIE